MPIGTAIGKVLLLLLPADEVAVLSARPFRDVMPEDDGRVARLVGLRAAARSVGMRFSGEKPSQIEMARPVYASHRSSLPIAAMSPRT